MESGFITEEECIEHQNIATGVGNKAIDKTWLFLVNQMALSHVDSKFCIGRPWNEVSSSSTSVKASPVTTVSVMWWGIP